MHRWLCAPGGHRVCVWEGGGTAGQQCDCWLVHKQSVCSHLQQPTSLKLVAAVLCLLCGLSPACPRSSSLLTRVQIVAANGLDALAGGPVSIISGKVEEVEGIGHDKVTAGHTWRPQDVVLGGGAWGACVFRFVRVILPQHMSAVQQAGHTAQGRSFPFPLLPCRCL